MRKSKIHFIWVVMMIALLSFGISNTAHAYTEEEKQQAKAWLSAHGYSPDAGGASQAYQDYLNGKFDEELGINTTEQTTTGTTEDASGEASEKATETDDKSEEEKTGEKENISSGSAKHSDTNGTEVPDEEGTQEEGASGKEASSEEASEKGESLETDTVSKEKNQEITLYQEKNQDAYKEAGIVIALSALLMVVLKGIVVLVK